MFNPQTKKRIEEELYMCSAHITNIDKTDKGWLKITSKDQRKFEMMMDWATNCI